MKAFRLLTLLAMMSYCAFSQGLKPTLTLLQGDTAFCFSILQSKEIAKHLKSGLYKDTVITVLERGNERLFGVVHLKDSIIEKQKQENRNLEMIGSNDKENIRLLEGTISMQDKKLNQNKTEKLLLKVGLALATFIAVIK